MSLTIATGAIVCNESQLVGEISIGTRTVVHPKVCEKYKKIAQERVLFYFLLICLGSNYRGSWTHNNR